MPATLREIALKAGVAASTVSRALRNDPSIPATTCRRLQELAEKFGYRPDPLIVALVDRRWNRGAREVGTIAWVTTYLTRADHRNLFHQTILAGGRARAEALGYGLEEFWLREAGMTGRRLSQILVNRGIRGVCVAPLPVGRGHLTLKWEHFSCATIGYSMIRPNLHRAAPHQFQGIMEALRQLRHQGYRRIGVLMNREENRKVNYHWMAGALLFAELYAGVKCSLLVGEDSDQAGLSKWIEQHQLEMILASTDGVKYRIKNLGLKVASATLLWTEGSGIPGVDQKLFEVGASAIDLVVGQIRRNETGIPKNPRVVMVEGEWRE